MMMQESVQEITRMGTQKHQPAYLLTGRPQVGKSSAIKNIVNMVGMESCGGFYTEEIREHGTRRGFRLVTFDGREGILASKGLASPLRIGGYGVDLTCLNTLGVTSVYTALQSKKLIVIDEIGPMEILSEQFRQMVLDVLNSSISLLGTIALRSHLWLDMVKRHERVMVYELTTDNRDQVVQVLAKKLSPQPH
jgi:nucleoside-triphosphatase